MCSQHRPVRHLLLNQFSVNLPFYYSVLHLQQIVNVLCVKVDYRGSPSFRSERQSQLADEHADVTRRKESHGGKPRNARCDALRVNHIRACSAACSHTTMQYVIEEKIKINAVISTTSRLLAWNCICYCQAISSSTACMLSGDLLSSNHWSLKRLMMWLLFLENNLELRVGSRNWEVDLFPVTRSCKTEVVCKDPIDASFTSFDPESFATSHGHMTV